MWPGKSKLTSGLHFIIYKMAVHRRQTISDSLYSQRNLSFILSKFSLALSLFLPWVTGIWPDGEVSGLASSSCPRTAVLISVASFLHPASWCDLGVRRFTFWSGFASAFCVPLDKAVSTPSFLWVSQYSQGALGTTQTRPCILRSCLMFPHFHVLLTFSHCGRLSHPKLHLLE